MSEARIYKTLGKALGPEELKLSIDQESIGLGREHVHQLLLAPCRDTEERLLMPT